MESCLVPIDLIQCRGMVIRDDKGITEPFLRSSKHDNDEVIDYLLVIT